MIKFFARKQATATLYVGADNLTGICDVARIETLVAKSHQGFTILVADGVWQGAHEATALVIISGPVAAIRATARLLAQELQQDAIGITWAPAMEFVS